MSKRSLNFAANVTMMFKEFPTLSERIIQAKVAGFQSVEITQPYDEAKENIAKALKDTELNCVLINSWPGPGNRGIAAKPDKIDIFKEKLELSIEYAKAFNCPRIHILAGCKNLQCTESEARETYVNNIRYAADRLAQENIEGMLETVNAIHTTPNFYLDTPEKALELIQEIKKPNIKFQMDLFHFQIIKGDLTNNIMKYLPHTGYIQVSQVPARGEPDSPGEINYAYIFDLLKQLEYKGWIGTEYNPIGNTIEGLSWMKKFMT